MAQFRDTAKVMRRPLRFESIAELIAEIDRIVAADQSGTLEILGNWTPGQVLSHLAAWIEYGYDGYPVRRAPWLIRMILRLKLKQYLRDGMPAGQRIPGVPDGTTGADRLGTDEAADRLRRALRRLDRGEPALHDSPGFGPMSHQDRIQLNLRHAELHLGFCNMQRSATAAEPAGRAVDRRA